MIIVNCNFYVANFKSLGIACCVTHFFVPNSIELANHCKDNADFGGQRYVKQAESRGLTEG
jgi:hypothetical protein